MFLTDLSSFDETINRNTDHLKGNALLICGSREMMFYTIYLLPETASPDTFHPVQNRFPIVIYDEMGNEYDDFGKVISGPDAGNGLDSPVFYEARTFSWELFYAEIELFE